MRILKVMFLIGLWLCPASSWGRDGRTPSLFDKPLLEKHAPLPRDPANPQFKPLLSCFYYPLFMVKQVDLGEEGAEQLSILYREKGREQPLCRRANAKDEMVINPNEWTGYFKGVRGKFVFSMMRTVRMADRCFPY